MAEDNAHPQGRVVRVIGPVVDVEFPPNELPDIYTALTVDITLERHHHHDHVRGGAAHRRQHHPGDRAEADGRPDPRSRGDQHRLPDQRARRRGGARSRLQRARRAARHRHLEHPPRHVLADPPRAAPVRGPRAEEGHARDGHQGDRPARAVRAGRQDRDVRRCGRGQDRDHPGDDPPPGRAARWCVGVRRRGGAHPRGQRPVPGDDRVRRDREDRAGVRPDGRAARRASARRALGADDGRVLPRREAPGRAAVRGQHLPVHAGGLGGLDAARPDAERRGLPAEPGGRDGRAAGADHVRGRPVDHVAAGDLRPGRRHHGPGAARGVRPPGRHDRALA